MTMSQQHNNLFGECSFATAVIKNNTHPFAICWESLHSYISRVKL